jgi:SAM-dependent methyltransferase
MQCESFQSPTAEPLANGGGVLNWHKKVFNRNLQWSKELLDYLLNNNQIKPKYVLDIGCGIGTLLFACKNYNIKGIGFDTDAIAVEYGRNQFDLDLKDELWEHSKTLGKKIDLITCISLLEHIHFPRNPIEEIVASLKAHNATAFISVPLFNRGKWSYLKNHNAIPGKTPPNMHVTHFSDKGLVSAFQHYGAKNFEKIAVGGWVGFLISA